MLGANLSFSAVAQRLRAVVIARPKEPSEDTIITFNGQPVTFNGTPMIFTADAFAARA